MCIRDRDTEAVQDITDALSKMFRYAVQNPMEPVKITEEINHVRNYLKIQEYRLGAMPRLQIELGEAGEASMLRLCLQPIVENIFKHAFAEGIKPVSYTHLDVYKRQVTDSEEQIQRGLELFCGRHGCRWERTGGSGPSYFPKEHPAVDLLTGVYNEIMGLETKPFVMGGGTYAKKLPSAFAYGVGGMPKTEEEKNCHLFQPQHGGCLLYTSFTGILIQTGQGILEVRQLQLEGKKRMDALAFLRGHKLPIHTVLG